MKPSDSLESFKESIFQITSETFEPHALALFAFQARNNPVYKEYIAYRKIDIQEISSLSDIPFLPIDFFKTHRIASGEWQDQRIFKSSGTGLSGRSKHFVQDLSFYHRVSGFIANRTFGSLNDKSIFGLLPSYLEQGDSSLVEMVRYFQTNAKNDSGFFLKNHEELIERIDNAKGTAIVIGVSYALLDLALEIDIDLSGHVVIETGGMKGRKREMLRKELHDVLSEKLKCTNLYSEYGMTELLSQAYGRNGRLKFPAWCRPLVRELDDPMSIHASGKGALNIIDLANVHSCAFIETKDLVEVSQNQEFEILGRMDNSDIRGCSLLI